MKDSGIEWLGDVPAHWGIVRLKHIASIRYGLSLPPKESDNGLPLIRATNVERGKINSKGLIYVSPTDVPYDRNPVLHVDDIVVVRSGAYTGDSSIITSEYDGAIIGYDMVVSAKRAESNFIAYSLLSDFVLINQIYQCKLRAAQPHINAEELGNCIVTYPSGFEQKKIIIFLNQRTSQIDALIDKVTQSIENLREYRTALISAAVTGKIDIREEIV